MRFRYSLLFALYCVLAENFHLIYQYLLSGEDPDVYYFIVDLSMYSAKAAIALWAVLLLRNPPENRGGHFFLLYTMAVYYIMDCVMMFVTGNYDGVGPMLAGMLIAMTISASIHFREKYKIVERDSKNKIGF